MIIEILWPRKLHPFIEIITVSIESLLLMGDGRIPGKDHRIMVINMYRFFLFFYSARPFKFRRHFVWRESGVDGSPKCLPCEFHASEAGGNSRV